MLERKNIKEYSIKELRVICQKTAPDPASESLMGRFSRFFSIYITKLFLYTKITPNQITGISVIVFFIGVFMFFIGSYYYNVVGTLIIFFSIILDGSDGEVARFRQKKSFVGGLYTEPVSHDIQYGFSYFLIGLALYLNGYSYFFVFLGSISSIFVLEYRLLGARFYKIINAANTEEEKQQRKKEIRSQKNKNIFHLVLSRLNKNFLSSTSVFPVLLFFSLINHLEYSLVFYAFGYFLLYLALFIKHIYLIIKNRH